MPDPRIAQRNNPLTRALNQVAQLNEELGTRRTGGGLPTPAPGPSSIPPPTPVPSSVVMGGSGTVLPPPPRPLTNEEALQDGPSPAEIAELEQLWASDPSNPANGPGRTEPFPLGPSVPSPRALPTSWGKGTYIDVIQGILYTDTGMEIKLSEEAAKEIKIFAYNVTVIGLKEQIAASMRDLKVAMGLEEEGGEKQEVSQMRHGSGHIEVPPPEENVPPVRIEGSQAEGTARPGGGQAV